MADPPPTPYPVGERSMGAAIFQSPTPPGKIVIAYALICLLIMLLIESNDKMCDQ